MNSEALYRSFHLASQKLQLEACFASPSHDAKADRVFREVQQLFESEELQQRLREKRR